MKNKKIKLYYKNGKPKHDFNTLSSHDTTIV